MRAWTVKPLHDHLCVHHGFTLSYTRTRAPLTDKPFRSKPFCNGNPWFLPLIVSWLKRVDRKSARD